MGKWNTKNSVGENGANYQNAKIKIKCCFCKKKFIRYKIYAKEHKHNFCCRKCYDKWMSKYQIGKNHPLYTKVKIKCEYCGKICFKSKYRLKNTTHLFCSKKCANKGKSKFITGKNHPNWKGIFLTCSICHKKYKTFPSRKRSRKNKKKFNYCSFDCRIKGQSKFLIGKLANAYIHGKGKEPYTISFNNFCKEQVRIRDKYKVTSMDLLTNVVNYGKIVV